ncbi:hypothetical protein CFC21_086045 [Triticum aestivum]|uniref:Leucine-rich repeat-containing N-terminal plant-type domain-containing protein n=2 Tax=Triticum aestivum TaxID=4565 RepID=A0A3B6PGC6_WHEAT|nr:hypothetical protein CFC21_086045 [Triticum aestivum]
MSTPPEAAFTTGILLILALLISAGHSHAATESEAEALLDWKVSLRDPDALSSWNKAAGLCSWRGVSCNDAGRVESLRLHGLGLAGTLDKLDTMALPALTVFDLNDNNFVGSIPASLSQLHYLTVLDLGSNGFNGSISPQLSNLSGLVDLRLYNNNFVGDIPYQLSRLPRIVHFDLGSNFLTNPEGYRRFSPMPTVTFMWLYLNYLTGIFPKFVLESGNITYLDLSQNNVSGPIPYSLPEKLPNIKYLNLSVNAFSGQIPASLSMLGKLRAYGL